jgi:hypothetical protein
MNKRSQIALAFAAGYLLLKMGIAIYRHPVGAVVVFAILTVFSVIGGASASDVETLRGPDRVALDEAGVNLGPAGDVEAIHRGFQTALYAP